jgi:hypothetical protein
MTKIILVFLLLNASSALGQDAAQLEAQYKTCSKHYIPAEKCTPEIYAQLKEKDNAPPDPDVAHAVAAIHDYQRGLKNRGSLEVQTAYITDKGDLCLAISGQNSLGGSTVSRVVLTAQGKWKDDTGFLADAFYAGNGPSPGGVDRWPVYCTKPTFGFHSRSFRNPKMVPGTDITDAVNRQLKTEKEQ